MKINKKIIFSLCFFICLICISHSGACEGVDNSTSLDVVADTSTCSDLHFDDVLDVSNHDISNINHDIQQEYINILGYELTPEKLEKLPNTINYGNKAVKDNAVSVGNFSLFNKDFDDFKHNIFAHNIISNEYTFNLNKDYVYDSTTDSAFREGIDIHHFFFNGCKLIINGNGHFIDGKCLACAFRIFNDNVEICNVTFRNLTTIHSYYLNDMFGRKYPLTPRNLECHSPIVWLGNNGVITNCTFRDNTGGCGGSIMWKGNNGIIDHNKFINNNAMFLGGFAYINGVNNVIRDNLVVNCEARLDGDALYVKNLNSNNVSQMTYIKVNKANSTFICPDVVDGSLFPVDSSAFRPAYVSLGCSFFDITQIIYGCLYYGRSHFELDDGVNAFLNYDKEKKILSLTFDKFLSPTLEMRKTLNINLTKSFTHVFESLNQEKGEFELIKHIIVNNMEDYKKAIDIVYPDVQTEYSNYLIKCLNLPDNFKSDSINALDIKSIMGVLNVKFNKTMDIDCSLSWTPRGFDLINIDGANSYIHTKNRDKDEKKFVDWKGDALFVASNLKISGFNNAFKNIASQMLLRNVEIFGNRMNYHVDRDYGAGLLNTGVTYCMNCTFHDNYAKYGGAIFNQGFLVLTNSSFKSNTGYGKGNDIMNVDKGIVTIDGKTYNACGGGIVDYKKSLSSGTITAIKIACYVGSFVIGVVAGFFTANPLVGMAVGAALGAAVGTIGSAVICSNVYDVNFCRWSCALSLIIGCAGAGATGGQIGGAIRTVASLASSSTIKSATTAADAAADAAKITTNVQSTAETVHDASVLAVHSAKDSMIAAGYTSSVADELLCNSIEIAAEAARNAAVAEGYMVLSPYWLAAGQMATAHVASELASAAASIAINNVIGYGVSTAIISSAIALGCIAGIAAGLKYVPDAVIVPTTQHTDFNETNIDRIKPADSNTFILSSNFISNMKSENNLDTVNNLIVNSKNKISFSDAEVLDAISSINCNSPFKTVLY